MVFLLIPSVLYSDHCEASTNDSKTLLILGDSLSAGYGLAQGESWVSLLQNAWKEQGIHVINAAVSGETTDGGLARLPRLLDLHAPTHMLLELGGNDGLQGHSPAKIKANLQEMIEIAQGKGVSVILQQMQIPTNYGRRYNQMFVNNYISLAKEYDIPRIPFFLEDVALNPDLMQRDGIHPNKSAQPIIAEFMAKHLSPYLGLNAQSSVSSGN
ncbi:arylesterase [Fluctibacter corallii]|uniref:arylesterase n=1 Tax=Fluctibacter corallii TaxID=2984329 RepID=UPI00384D4BF3